MLTVTVVGQAAPVPAAAATLYVDQSDPDCTNSGVGEQLAPFCTISAAAKFATAGQTVLVASGTYAEHVVPANAGTATAPITYRPAPEASVTVSGGSHGFTVQKSWIVISGFTVTGTTSSGIYVRLASHVTLSGNRITAVGQPISGRTAQGIYVKDTTDSLILNNTTDHNSDTGIYLTSGVTRVEVRGNRSYANARQYTRAATGIDVRSPDNTVLSNVSHDNEDSGIQLYNGATRTIVAGNLVYGNGDHGIDVLNTTDAVVVSNTVYRSLTAGINIEGSKDTPASSGATVQNNLSVDNGLASTATKGNIRVDADSLSGTTLDYDLLHLSSAGVIGTWGSKTYTSLAAFASASGQEAHGLSTEPRWTAPDSGDFHLQSGSPAIDAANSAAPGQPPSDAESNPRVDDPATSDSGVGPRSYDDRGALEYQFDEPPSAAVEVTPSSGTMPLDVVADASGSTDTDGTPIASYWFDFGDGAVVGPQAEATAGHIYTAAGTYTVTVTVTDTAGYSSAATDSVTVAAPAPPNLVGNPGFETNLVGWNNNGRAGITLTQVAGGHSGQFAVLLANSTATTQPDCTLNDSPNWVRTTEAVAYQSSLWVRADTPGAVLKLRIREYSAGTFVGSSIATTTLSTTWQKLQVSYSARAPGSTLDLTAYTTNAPPGDCFYADDASTTLAQ